MRYRRVLLIGEVGDDVRAGAAALIRRVAPAAELLLVVARLPGAEVRMVLSPDIPTDLNAAAISPVEVLREATAGARRAGGSSSSGARLRSRRRRAVLDRRRIGHRPARRAGGPVKRHCHVSELRKRRSLPVLWTGGTRSTNRPIQEVLCVRRFGSRARTAVGAFLRDHGAPAIYTGHGPGARAPRHGIGLEAALDVAGVEARVEGASPGRHRRPPVRSTCSCSRDSRVPCWPSRRLRRHCSSFPRSRRVPLALGAPSMPLIRLIAA